MVGMVTSHEPIRGIMAKQIKEYLQKVEIAEKCGGVGSIRSPRKTNVRLVEIANG